MAIIRGYEVYVYRLTTGSRLAWPGSGAPANLSLVSSVRSATRTDTNVELDVTTRASGGIRETISGLSDPQFNMEMFYDAADTHMVALRAAKEGKTVVALAFLDATSVTVGAHGFWGDFTITEFSVEEAIDGVATVSVVAKPTKTSVPNAYVTVA